MLDHLKQVHDAVNEDKVDVFAYYWRSFLHGYEWDLDYKRTVTKTAEVVQADMRTKWLLTRTLRNLPPTA